MIFFMIANYLYQFSFVFYNALLHHIAPEEKLWKIAGIWQAWNWIGSIVWLVITLPLASWAVYLFWEAWRAQTFLPSVLTFLALSLPMILFFKINKKEVDMKLEFIAEYKNQWNHFKDLIKNRNVKLFLIAFFLFQDAIITASNNFPIYLQNVFWVSDKVKSFILIWILITSAIWALVSWFVSDKIWTKKSLIIIIIWFIIIFPVLWLTSNLKLFVVFTSLMWFLFGSIWAVSKALMTKIVPKDKLNYWFSFYTLSERVSTLFWPLFWWLTTYVFSSYWPMKYRIAIITITIFIIAWLFIVRKIDTK